ncbi:MAG: flagellar hook-associated protein FlgK [Pseudomonadota bacterium]
MPDLLSTGVSGLLAFRAALDATGHNIANVNTPGYSRQSVNISSRLPVATDGPLIGSGVQVDNVQRTFNEFLAGEVRLSMSSFGRMNSFAALANRVDSLVADTTSGVGPGLQDMFDSIQAVADDPASLPARDALLGSAEALTERFRGLSSSYDQLESEVNDRVRDSVSTINGIATAIADLNGRIALARGVNANQEPNELLDQRELLIQELSGMIALTTNEQTDGSINIFIGNGQTLVIGSQNAELGTVPNQFDPTSLDVVYQGGGGTDSPITTSLVGGALGGLLDFRREMLDPARNELGRIATAMSLTFNELQAGGMDLNGLPGTDMFSVEGPRILGSSQNTGAGVVDVTISDLNDLTLSDYTLLYDGANHILVDSQSGQAVPMGGSGTALDPYTADGLEIVVSGMAAGDQFRIEPTVAAASSLAMTLEDPSEFAAALPIRTEADGANTGSGIISAGTVVDGSDPNLQTTSVIEFTGPNTYSINGAGAFAYTDGDPITINGAEFTISGTPDVGDTFTLEANTGGFGDNRNALAMGELSVAGVLDGGRTGMQDAYGQLVARVGSSTRQINAGLEASSMLLNNAQELQAGTSGVNLDEEAARMIQYQQSYQAAAQIINVADTLFQTLISSFR